jgi:hypothetical protein
VFLLPGTVVTNLGVHLFLSGSLQDQPASGCARN